MSRVKIKFPNEKPLLTVSIPIRVGDVNYGGHVGNDVILSIIHEARVQLFAHGNMTELDVGGCGVIMGDVSIAYKGESFYKDILNVEMYVEDITSISFSILYNISTLREEKTVLIAHARSGMICFDYDERKVTGIPNSLKSFLKGV